MAELAEEVKQVIATDIWAADLKLSLFNAALNSYKYDSVLNPYPTVLLDSTSKEKHINKLRHLANNVPELKEVIDCQLNAATEPDMAVLLYWMFIGCNSPQLKKITSEQMSGLKLEDSKLHKPQFIFEVLHDQENNEQFERRRNGRRLLYAYHGSRVENFHSILHGGLKGHLNKTSLFGSGTYLSSELSISLLYSPSGATWKKSLLGPSVSCVAVCQVIDDPHVKCHSKMPSQFTKSRAADSEAGDVPNKYLLVTNNDLIRVKYILVYVSQGSSSRPRQQQQRQGFSKFTMLMLAYIVVLVAVGLAKSKFAKNIFY